MLDLSHPSLWSHLPGDWSRYLPVKSIRYGFVEFCIFSCVCMCVCERERERAACVYVRLHKYVATRGEGVGGGEIKHLCDWLVGWLVDVFFPRWQLIPVPDAVELYGNIVVECLKYMQTSYEKAVCAVCVSVWWMLNAWIVTKWKKALYRFLYHRKDI